MAYAVRVTVGVLLMSRPWQCQPLFPCGELSTRPRLTPASWEQPPPSTFLPAGQVTSTVKWPLPDWAAVTTW